MNRETVVPGPDDALAAARVEAEAGRRQFALLAESSALLGSSLDYQATLDAVARLAVPELADWCVVYLTDQENYIESVAASHRDSRRDRALQLLGARYPLERGSGNPIVRAVSTGRSELHPVAPPDLLRTILPDAAKQYLLRDEDVTSYISVPLPGRDGVAGAVTLARTRRREPYNREDLALAEELAARAGMAVDNARLYQEMRDAVQVRDEFLASASHELRTPVTTIKAFSQMLQRRLFKGGKIDQGELLEVLQSIDGNASRLAAQINELLDLSRLQAGRAIELYRRPTDLVPLLHRAVDMHRLLSGRHTFRVDCELSELTGMWDGFRMERVLNNLLSNAVKFSPPDGEIVAVLTDRRDPGAGRTAVLSVHDQGIGIPKGDLPHIFEKYYRAANVPERAYGTGIGLAGVLEIVRLHGGTIGVESAEGKGTTCTVTLPCSDISAMIARTNSA